MGLRDFVKKMKPTEEDKPIVDSDEDGTTVNLDGLASLGKALKNRRK